MNTSASAVIEKATPMMQQYLKIKQEHQDCLLLYRMGDFYELFYSDATEAAPILEIALTKRGKNNGDDIPMCGIPHHSSEVYIQKLIKAGKKVAICEQLETPEEAKKRGYKSVVKREVVRILTPGTLTEDNLLQGKKANYLASIVIENNKAAIAYADISTLEFAVISSDVGNLYSDLSRLNPTEVIMADSLIINQHLKDILDDFKCRVVTFVDSFFNPKKTERKIQHNFDLRTIESLGDFDNNQIAACGSLIEYLSITQKKEKIFLSFPKIIEKKDYMILDKITQSNLEIFDSKGEHGYSLLKIIDNTLTNAGGRLLRKFLSFPSVNLKTINDRLDLVEFFINNYSLCDKIRNILKKVPDIERSIAKIAIKRALPRDLYHIKQALEKAIIIANLCNNNNQNQLSIIAKKFFQGQEALALLKEALVERDAYFNEEDFIDRKYNLQLEELYEFRDNSRSTLDHLRREYVQKTGIHNLKIEFNNVLGYYIEVTKAQAKNLDCSELIHRQTMVNNVRFVSNKLKEVESKIIDINHQIELLEAQIFNEITDEVLNYREIILDIAKSISYLDVISSFAYFATNRKYSRPEINDTADLIIKEGKHPIIECSIEKNNQKFIENDLKLDQSQKIWLITGPNMSGKSTFLRQNAIISILGHIGSFVPAKFAKIGLIDRIFSRIGAGDDLAKGHSTFLVEMIETAVILNQATNKSLIILDEIGRGTSTYDGIAIAWSCLEYLHNHIKGRTLFSTHYHELTDLAKKLDKMSCYTVKVKEWENKIIFMHKVIPGIANCSYGINVAEIAGIPKDVVKRSKTILQKLNDRSHTAKVKNHHKENLDLLDYKQQQEENSITTKLVKINPDELSPKEALQILYQLKESL